MFRIISVNVLGNEKTCVDENIFNINDAYSKMIELNNEKYSSEYVFKVELKSGISLYLDGSGSLMNEYPYKFSMLSLENLEYMHEKSLSSFANPTHLKRLKIAMSVIKERNFNIENGISKNREKLDYYRNK